MSASRGDVMQVIETVLSNLSVFKEGYAIYGSHAANLYRETERAGTSFDIALALGSAKRSRKECEAILKELGYTIEHEWLDGLHSAVGKTVGIVIGKHEHSEQYPTIHFYLPSLPWVSKGVRRGQLLECDVFGSTYPAIPVEDLVIAKIHSISGRVSGVENRLEQEVDDLVSIFKSETPIEIPYVLGEINMLDLKVHSSLSGHVPPELEKYLNS